MSCSEHANLYDIVFYLSKTCPRFVCMFEKQAVSVPVPDEIANAYPMHLIGDESSTLIKHGRVQKALEFGIISFYDRKGCVAQASNEATSSSAKRLCGWVKGPASSSV